MADHFDPSKDRWPPIYDADDLKTSIEQIANNPGVLFANFYIAEHNILQGEYCQGDIIRLAKEIPCLDENGDVAALDAETTFWVVVGNSCDLDRPLLDVAWTLIMPIQRYRGQASSEKLAALKKFDYARGFYVPPWTHGQEDVIYLADFLRPVSIHRQALMTAPVVARMDYCGWMLFHCCLVRFLARGDGRFD